MRNYGHNDYATLQEPVESVLPVERPGDASSGSPEGAGARGGLSDQGIISKELEVSAEEAAETIDAAEVLIRERQKYEEAVRQSYLGSSNSTDGPSDVQSDH